jgi:hypothetical protein
VIFFGDDGTDEFVVPINFGGDPVGPAIDKRCPSESAVELR